MYNEAHMSNMLTDNSFTKKQTEISSGDMELK